MSEPTANPAAVTEDPPVSQEQAGSAGPLLGRPGAVPVPDPDDPDAGVAWHYGDPTREQRALAAGTALTDLSHRGLLAVTGPDRLTWLHSLTSQTLTDLTPGVVREALVLSPYGHVEHSLHVLDDGTRTLLSVDATSMRPAPEGRPSSPEPLADWLRSMRFRKKVAVEDLSGQYAALGVVAPPGAGLAPELAAVEGIVQFSWQDPWPEQGPDTAAFTEEGVEHPGWHRPWRELWIPRDQLATATADVALAGSWAAEALRVAAWRPRVACDTDHRTLPHELDWLRTGLRLNKGCYRGQETVSRVHFLGHPPRRVVLLHLDGSGHDLPRRGDALHRRPFSDGDRPVGVVTTPVRHHELGPIALALLKRTVPVDADLLAGDIAASQETIARP